MEYTATHASTRNATSPPALPHYPGNRTGWLHTFNRALIRAEAAREIGIEAMLLILAIAMQEDLQQYRVPPAFFFHELQRMLGIRSKAQLERARQQAIDAGWLVMLPGPLSDLAAARYWTVIPVRLNLSDDAPHDVTLAAAEMNLRRGAAGCLDELQPACPTLPLIPERQLPNSPLVVDVPLSSSASNSGSTRSVTAAGTAGASETKVSQPILSNVIAPESKMPDLIQEARGPNWKFRNYLSLDINQHTRAQAMDLYAAYPRVADSETEATDALKDMQAIHRALSKITYAELIPIVRRFATFQNRRGADPKLIPPLVKWFDEGRWQQV
jgi:hypothetical protein